MPATGLIFNIQKFSLHDGPGIRTTVFLKGCPLRCQWCHNMESQRFERELEFKGDACTGCAACTDACPEEAIALNDGRAATDMASCTFCGSCITSCPQNGRNICGREISLSDLMTEILKDRVFYRQSGGGVTFSGGEAMSQIDFLDAAVKACKAESLHVAIDTCGQAPWSSFERILKETDLFLYDLKLLDPERHLQLTGVTNQTILDNLQRLSDAGKLIDIRIPVLPGITDDDRNIGATIAVLRTISFGTLHLLPYHQYGEGKAKHFSNHNSSTPFSPPTAKELENLSSRFAAAGFRVKIGG